MLIRGGPTRHRKTSCSAIILLTDTVLAKSRMADYPLNRPSYKYTWYILKEVLPQVIKYNYLVSEVGTNNLQHGENQLSYSHCEQKQIPNGLKIVLFILHRLEDSKIKALTA